MKFEDLGSPMNAQERYLYATVIRLDALCHMVSSLVDVLAKKEGIAVEENTVQQVEVPVSKKRKKKE